MSTQSETAEKSVALYTPTSSPASQVHVDSPSHARQPDNGERLTNFKTLVLAEPPPSDDENDWEYDGHYSDDPDKHCDDERGNYLVIKKMSGMVSTIVLNAPGSSTPDDEDKEPGEDWSDWEMLPTQTNQVQKPFSERAVMGEVATAARGIAEDESSEDGSSEDGSSKNEPIKDELCNDEPLKDARILRSSTTALKLDGKDKGGMKRRRQEDTAERSAKRKALRTRSPLPRNAKSKAMKVVPAGP